MNQYFFDALFALYPQIIRTVGLEAFDAENNQVEYNSIAVQEEADKMACKQQAQDILYKTDWTTIADVGNPSASNPYLLNQGEFIAYRSSVRAIVLNPTWDAVFPTEPTEQWSS